MKSGVFIIFVSVILVLSVSFVSAGIFCDVFGGNFCDDSGRELRGELFQSSGSSGGGGSGNGSRGLVSHYSFEDNYQDSAGDNDGSGVGGANFVEGREGLGRAISLSNRGYVLVPHDSSLDLTESWTMSAWVNPARASGFQAIISKTSYNRPASMWLYDNNRDSSDDANQVQIWYLPGGNILSTSRRVVSNNIWQHITIVRYENETIGIYYNGVLNVLKSDSDIPNTNNRDLTIGQRGDNSYFYNGMVDEVKIWNRALSTEDIGREYRGEGGEEEDDLNSDCQWADRDLNGIVEAGPDIDQYGACFGSSISSNPGCFWADRDNSGVVGHGDNVPLANCVGERVPITPYCEDSGNDYEVRGAVNYKDADINDIELDTCLNDHTLSEKSCVNNQAANTDIRCDEACVDGACVEDVSVCQDIGGNISTCNSFGCVLIGSDECLNSVFLQDVYCNGNELAVQEVECEAVCNEGECIDFQCEDGIDNDNDGLVDFDDPNCDSPFDNNEACENDECVNLEVTVSSIEIVDDELIVTYQKNFDTCLIFHETPVTQNNIIGHFGANFCEKGEHTVTNSLGNFDSEIEIGQEISLCHGNDIVVCSEPVVVGGCVDSDEGFEYSGKGFVNFGGTEYYDFCQILDLENNEAIRLESCLGQSCGLVEQSCNNNELTPNRYECPFGCTDGACIEEVDVACEEGYICLDSDNFNATVNLNDINYEIELVTASDFSAVFNVNGETVGEISELGGVGIANDNGVLVYLKSADLDGTHISAVLKPYPITNLLLTSDSPVNVVNTRGENVEIRLVSASTTSATIRVNDQPNEIQINEEAIFGEYIISLHEVYVNNNYLTALIELSFSDYQVCGPMIEEMLSPVDIIDSGIAYDFDWSDSSEESWYIDDRAEEYTRYYAGWRLLDNEDDNVDYMYINQELSVFDNLEVDATTLVEEMTSPVVCKKENFWTRDNEQNTVYICNWDVLRNNQNLESSDYTYLTLYWADNNVMVRLSVSYGKYFSDEELRELAQDSLIEYLNGLRDNEFEYIGWEYFDLPWQARNFVERSLSQCNSDITFEDDECTPNWQCKTEPIICPPHGSQTKTCIDYGCGSPNEVQVSQCSPGICSGCYVSKWYESNDNRCIPYGFRFEDEGEERVELVERTDRDHVTERSGDENDGYTLEILSDTEAFFSFGGLNYTLIEGEEFRISGDDGIEYFDLEIIDVVEATEEDEGYVDMIIRYESEISTREKIPSYCEIDGNVNVQKSNLYDDISCQNNYECESNLCSNGECVDLAGEIERSGAFRDFLIKVVCRISTLVGDDYGQCLAEGGIEQVIESIPVA